MLLAVTIFLPTILAIIVALLVVVRLALLQTIVFGDTLVVLQLLSLAVLRLPGRLHIQKLLRTFGVNLALGSQKHFLDPHVLLILQFNLRSGGACQVLSDFNAVRVPLLFGAVRIFVGVYSRIDDADCILLKLILNACSGSGTGPLEHSFRLNEGHVFSFHHF